MVIRVQELPDGEELVVESGPGRDLLEDPRERAIEVRRLVVRRVSPDEDQAPEGNQP